MSLKQQQNKYNERIESKTGLSSIWRRRRMNVLQKRQTKISYSQNRLEYIWCLQETFSLFSSGPRTRPDGSGLTLLLEIIFSALTFLEITVISSTQGHENCEKFLVCRDVWLKRRYADPKQTLPRCFFFSLKGFCDCVGDDMYYCSFILASEKSFGDENFDKVRWRHISCCSHIYSS